MYNFLFIRFVIFNNPPTVWLDEGWNSHGVSYPDTMHSQKPGYDDVLCSFSLCFFSRLHTYTLIHTHFAYIPLESFARWMNSQRSDCIEAEPTETNAIQLHKIISKDSKRGETKNFKMRFPSQILCVCVSESIIKFSKPHFQHFTFISQISHSLRFALSHGHSEWVARLHVQPVCLHTFYITKNDFDIANTNKAISHRPRSARWALLVLAPWLLPLPPTPPHASNNVSNIKKSLLLRKFLHFASF